MTKRGRICVLLVTGVALAGAAVLLSRAQQPRQGRTMNVAGVVKDGGGTQVVDATVRLVCWSAEALKPMKELPARVCEGASDNHGAFRILCRTERQEDDCELSVMKTGFRVARLRVQADHPEPIVIVMRLESGV